MIMSHQAVGPNNRMSVALQGNLDERGSQLQQQVGMNQQLMKRKEDMEWQLMSVLVQVHGLTRHVYTLSGLQDKEGLPFYANALGLCVSVLSALH